MGRKALVTIVRHGETDYNKAQIIQGHLDIPLNAQGEAQAAVTARWFREQGVQFDEAWSSDLSRARRTAGIILEQQKEQLPLQQDERIRERHLGNLQGKRRGDPGTDPSTVEPIAKLRARLWSFWSDLFPSSPSSAPSTTPTPLRQILYVSHGAAIREFVRSIVEDRVDKGAEMWELALPKDEEEVLRSGSKRIDNCSRTVIELEEEEDGKGGTRWRARLLLYGDDSHFAESSRAPSPTANADVVE
ncbi:hypothetical protein JCM10207_002839 [Rhodosporidiobolus poonsookiae]